MMLPVVAPLGTTMPVIWVPAAFTVNPDVTVLLAVPAKTMELALAKKLPFRVMVVPTAALEGDTLLSTGTGVRYSAPFRTPL
jgi:hypothetical protein